MFKFAKYFFIVFLITTILPLVVMYAWTNSQMQKFHSYITTVSVNNAKNKTEHNISNNLKVQEGDILKKLYFINTQNYDINSVKKLLNNYTVTTINETSKYPYSFYENDKTSVYLVTILPYKKINGSLKISKKANLDLMRPEGPFKLELTSKLPENGKGIVYLQSVEPNPPEKPKTGKPSKFIKIADKIFNLTPKTNPVKSIEIKNDKGKVIAYLNVSMELRPSKGKIEKILTGFIILIVGIFSSFIIGLLINRVFVLPIMAISNGAKEVEKGNLSYKLDIVSKKSPKVGFIKHIYNSFNDMVQNLATKEKLRESFISNLTHDLRTPLLSQAQSLGFISDKFKEIGLENEYELAKSLANNNEHLLKMVNLILESYSFDSSKLRLIKEPVDICELVESCREKLIPLFNDKKITFINNIYEGGTKINVDMFQMSRVFINLLSNAVENTKEGDFIKVSAHFNENSTQIVIEDNGNGIAPEDLNIIFERYYSGKSLERKLGSGLGLSVCEKIIKLHGGNISVESELNKYTKFTITLPV